MGVATRHWLALAGIVALGALGALGSPALGSPQGSVGGLAPAQLASLGLHAYPGGMRPPEFSLPALEGPTIALAGLRGQVVLLNFLATWCLECRAELPALEALHQRFGPRGLAVVGINVRESRSVVRSYVHGLGLTCPVLLDSDGTVIRRYWVVGLPTTFLVGRDGDAVALAVGPREWGGTAATAIVESLLAAPSGEPGRRGDRP
jgi:peroxiredoxin